MPLHAVGVPLCYDADAVPTLNPVPPGHCGGATPASAHSHGVHAGDYFGIGVSGYPEAHPDAIVEDKEQMEKNYWSDIHYLKEKLDAGADFVVTQLFYDVDRFIAWVKDCRSVGITAPIIPGIMPIMAYGGFNRMTSFCKTIVPQEIRDRVEALKDDDAGLKAYGVQLGCQMCRKILDAKISPGAPLPSVVPGLHMGIQTSGRCVSQPGLLVLMLSWCMLMRGHD